MGNIPEIGYILYSIHVSDLPDGYVRKTSAHSSEFAFQFECQDDGASNLGGVAIGMKINHAALPHSQLGRWQMVGGRWYMWRWMLNSAE